MNQQQLYRSPDLLKDSEADVARWLAQQEPDEGVRQMTKILLPTHLERKVGVALMIMLTLYVLATTIAQYLEVRFSWFFIVSFGFFPGTAACIILAKSPRSRLTEKRQKWLRTQIIQRLEFGGRMISLGTWIAGVESLGRERRRAYDSLARRLATATSEELQTLTQDERRWLRARLKDEWPGEALQIALLLALGTAGDIFVKPYARRLVTNPDESETVREAAEECLRCLERAG